MHKKSLVMTSRFLHTNLKMKNLQEYILRIVLEKQTVDVHRIFLCH